ncbi:hypothetical protein [Duodenibacillus massiliensis]
MKRRLFIQSALGAFFIPAAGELFAKTPVIADIHGERSLFQNVTAR